MTKKVDWDAVRDEFALRDRKTHLSTLVMASHRAGLVQRIVTLAGKFNEDPVSTLHDYVVTEFNRFTERAGAYFEVAPQQVAQCGSTTLGLGYILSSIMLRPGQRILTTAQEFPATVVPIDNRKRRHETPVDKIDQLFTHAHDAAAVVERLRAHVRPETRLLAITWVYSSTGFKSPIRAVTDMVQALNATRAPEDRILVCVDGVHGFGIENTTFGDLRCDFFVSGTHKWIFGPRGTGVIYATPEAWSTIAPAIWTMSKPANSPNGVHPYEHDFAVADAFEWLMHIGKDTVEARVRELALRLKTGLGSIPNVTLLTPVPAASSSGIVCCDVAGRKSQDVVDAMAKRFNIIATTSASDVLVGGDKHVRLSPSILNDEQDIDDALDAIEKIAR